VHFFVLQGLVFGPEAVAQAMQEARQQLTAKLSLAITRRQASKS